MKPPCYIDQKQAQDVLSEMGADRAEWGQNDFIDKIAIRPRSVELPRIFNQNSTEATAPVTDERLQDAYRTMAQIVSLHGETYLPIFVRLHAELESRKGEKSLLRTAKEVAGFEPDW